MALILQKELKLSYQKRYIIMIIWKRKNKNGSFNIGGF